MSCKIWTLQFITVTFTQLTIWTVSANSTHSVWLDDVINAKQWYKFFTYHFELVIQQEHSLLLILSQLKWRYQPRHTLTQKSNKKWLPACTQSYTMLTFLYSFTVKLKHQITKLMHNNILKFRKQNGNFSGFATAYTIISP